MFEELVTGTFEDAMQKVAAIGALHTQLHKTAAPTFMDGLKDTLSNAGTHIKTQLMAGNPAYTAGAGALALGGASAAHELMQNKRRKNWMNPVFAGLIGAGMGAAAPTATNAIKELGINYGPQDDPTVAQKLKPAVDALSGEAVRNGIVKNVQPVVDAWEKRDPTGFLPGAAHYGVKAFDNAGGTMIGGTLSSIARNIMSRTQKLVSGFEKLHSPKMDSTAYNRVLTDLGERLNASRAGTAMHLPTPNPDALTRLGNESLNTLSHGMNAAGLLGLLGRMERASLAANRNNKLYAPVKNLGKGRLSAIGNALSLLPFAWGFGSDIYHALSDNAIKPQPSATPTPSTGMGGF